MPTADKSPYVHQRRKAKNVTIKVKEKIPWTDHQKAFLSSAQDKQTKMLFVKGPAGCAKTVLATYCALKAIQEKKVSDIVYIRSVVESSSNKMGFLPGVLEDKFAPYNRPLEDKLDELLTAEDIKKMYSYNLIESIPVNYLRGAHFAGKYIVVDEAQNFTKQELTTIVTRVGEFSKVIVCGDPQQSDLPEGKSAFMRFYHAFEGAMHENICTWSFGIEDIVRSELLKDIVKIIENI